MFKAKSTLQRQKSMPQMKPASKNRATGHRSKTPPPKQQHNMKTIPATCVSSRTVPGRNFIRSAEDLHDINVRTLPRTKKENRTLSKNEILDIKYNEYVQICLAIAHSTQVRKCQEARILKELRQLQSKLAIMDVKMAELDVDIQKIEYLKEIKQKLLEKIQGYENLNGTRNSNRLLFIIFENTLLLAH